MWIQVQKFACLDSQAHLCNALHFNITYFSGPVMKSGKEWRKRTNNRKMFFAYITAAYTVANNNVGAAELKSVFSGPS